MKQYRYTDLTDFLSVRSIVTVLHVEMAGRVARGEAHGFPELLYVRSGQHSLKLDGEPVWLEPGQLIIYAPGTFHEGFLPSDAVLNIISFDGSMPEDFPCYNRVLTLSGKQQETVSQIFAEGLSVFRVAPESGLSGTVPRAGIAEYALQQLKNRFELFLIELYRVEAPSTNRAPAANQEQFRAARLQQVMTFLMEHLSQPLTLADIADGCSMSVSALKLLFKEQCGCGPIAFFLQLKIREAKKLLRDSSFSVTEISERLGFQSVHYFSRLFKEKTGESPSDYAKH